MAQPFRAPLDTIAGTVPIGAVQSATIVSEISGKLERWIARKQPITVLVPGIQDISILQGGSVWWCRGHAVPESDVVQALGSLLAVLLDWTDRHRAPAGLLYVVARATDPRHLAPFSGLPEFYGTLARYVAPRPRVAIDALMARYAIACSGLPPLGEHSTISDVRRLRRAGGVALAQIATDTAIPVSLLRELEWGVYTHWNLQHARGALDLYAERAGLDSNAVARVVDQEQAITVVSGGVEEHEASTAESTGQPAVPFALAALIAGAVVLGAPGDRSPNLLSTPALVRGVTAPIVRRVPAPIRDRPVIDGTHRQNRFAVKHQPRRARNVIAPPENAVAPPREVSRPLLRLARAIAGNGRYKVEPFPRVKAKTEDDK